MSTTHSSSAHQDAGGHDDGGHDDSFSIGAHKASYDDLNVPVILTVGFVSTILTVVAIFGVQALYYGYARSELTRKIYETTRTPQTEIVSEQQARLATYDHVVEKVDTSEGTAEVTKVSIPLEEAIPRVLESQKKLQADTFGESE